MEYVAKSALEKEGNIAWVEPLGLIVIRLAQVVLVSTPRNPGQLLEDSAVIRQELACSLKVTLRRVLVFQDGGIVTPLGQYGLTEIGLKSDRGAGCLAGFRAQGGRRLESQGVVAKTFRRSQLGPGYGEFRVQPHRFAQILLCAQGVSRCDFCLKGVTQSTQIGIVSLRIVCRFGGNDLLFTTSQFRL